MWSTCSIVTGHAWMQAPQVTQSQTDSSGTAPGTSGSSPPASAASRRPHDQELRREDLAGGVRRADVLAAAAFRAGERVEHLLPGEVGGRAGAEPEILLALPLLGLEAQRLQPPALRRSA